MSWKRYLTFLEVPVFVLLFTALDIIHNLSEDQQKCYYCQYRMILHKSAKKAKFFLFFHVYFLLYLIAHTPCNNAKRGAKAMVNTRATTLMIADSSLLSLNVLIADQEMLKSAIPQINIIIVSFILFLFVLKSVDLLSTLNLMFCLVP